MIKVKYEIPALHRKSGLAGMTNKYDYFHFPAL